MCYHSAHASSVDAHVHLARLNTRRISLGDLDGLAVLHNLRHDGGGTLYLLLAMPSERSLSTSSLPDLDRYQARCCAAKENEHLIDPVAWTGVPRRGSFYSSFWKVVIQGLQRPSPSHPCADHAVEQMSDRYAVSRCSERQGEARLGANSSQGSSLPL